MEERDSFKSRLGFILVSAGCAIGIGNVWKFPYITGQYGGAVFVLFYLAFLILLGIPVVTMELAVGRSSRKACSAVLKRWNRKERTGICTDGCVSSAAISLWFITPPFPDGWLIISGNS